MNTNRLLLGLAVAIAIVAVGCDENRETPPCSTCPEIDPAVEVALAFVESRMDSLGLRERTDRMDIDRVQKDQFDNTHVRMWQYYRGVRVDYGMLIVHVTDALVVFRLSGEVIPELDIDTRPELDRREALDIARDDMEARGYEARVEHSGESVIFTWFGTHYLCWRSILNNGGLVRNEYFINAHTGEIVYRRNLVVSQS